VRWYLLRDRRHEGPYTKEEVAVAVKAGKIDPRDYLLPEQAEKDQSTFAYLSVADVLGPEFIFDLNKSESAKTFHVRAPEQSSSPASASKESLISEFEDKLESTQLVQLRKERQIGDAPQRVVGESFTSQPAEGFKFPWAIAVIAIVVIAAAGFLAKPLLESSSSPAENTAQTAEPSAPATAFRNTKQNNNRLPTGRMQLPAANRDEEPEASAGPSSEELAEPVVRKKRKRKAVDTESTEAAEDTEAASDAEIDEEEYVDEYESEEDAVDEADI